MRQRFNPEKGINVILWIASFIQNPTFPQIFKLLYLADKEHLVNYGRLILGGSYVAGKHGPIFNEIFDMLKGVHGTGHLPFIGAARKSFEINGEDKVIPLQQPDLSVFTESEIECLEKTFQEYGMHSYRELTAITHDKFWSSVTENDRIDLEQIVDTVLAPFIPPPHHSSSSQQG